tara:strand:+ start:508 stop:816 length:309 start_codon:yes stop_codon:yes gene_type:complete
MTINTVKIQGEGWLVNGNMSVPNSAGNSDYHKVQEWIAEGNTPEPEFTNEENSKNAQAEINSENLEYLASTDWYVVRLMETDVAIPEDVYIKRGAARTAIVK